MDISQKEAQDSLKSIQEMTTATKRAIAAGGAHWFLLLWGVIWILGFTGAHFLDGRQLGILWTVIDVVGFVLTGIIMYRMNRGIRYTHSPATNAQIGTFWICLMLLVTAIIWVAKPHDGMQLSIIIVLGVIIGWMALGTLLAFYPVWVGMLMAPLALGAYFLLPDYYNLIMGFIGGGGMIAMGLYIRNRW